MQAIILSLQPPSTPGVRSKGQNSLFFLQKSYVASQIKANEMYHNMQPNILSLHTPSTPGWGLKVKTFFSDISHVAYEMNRKVGHAHTMAI